MVPLAEDLAADGYAVWNIEYRRVGQPGGGWPGTLDDVAAAVDHLTDVTPDPSARPRPRRLRRPLSGRPPRALVGRPPGDPAGDPGADPERRARHRHRPGPRRRALEGAAEQHVGNGAVIDFLGGTPSAVPDRYDARRHRALSAGPRMVAVVGSSDDIVPPEFSVDDDQPDAIEVVTIDGADHMMLIDPDGAPWAASAPRDSLN